MKTVIYSIVLSKAEIEILKRPINGKGGMQSLLRSLEDTRSGCVQYLTELQYDRLLRYVTKYGGGGFQGRLALIAIKIVQSKAKKLSIPSQLIA